MLRLLGLLLLCGPVGALSAGARGDERGTVSFYVAPNGSDSAAGSLEQPFATLQRAQAAVRAKTESMTADIVVNLRAGTYDVRQPLRLMDSAGDSGGNGHRVIYQAYGYGTPAQETPVISGGRPVENWKLSDKRRQIWRAGVGSLSTRQLYREGERISQGALNGVPGRLRRTRAGYTTSSTAPQKWANPSSIEFVYTTVGYSQAICGVAKIEGTRAKTTVTMDQPCFRWVSKNYTYNEADPASPQKLVRPSPVRNSRSFLTKARTWAIDRSRPGRHYIYYRAAAGENPNTLHFTAPEQQTLVKGSGTKGAPLHDVAFKGITFDNTTWLAPDKPRGFVQIFGDYYFDGGSPSGSLTEGTVKVRFVPGSLTFEQARNLLFEGDRFTHLGADAIHVTGSIGNVFRANVFEDSAGGAVKLDGLNDGSDTGNLFEDNWIHGVGRDYQGSIALYLEDIVDSTIRHNQINDVPSSGISHTISEAKGHGIQILQNRIFDVTRVMMDGGGIYTSGAQGLSYRGGGRIEGNVVHGARNPYMERTDPKGKIGAPNAIYTDVSADFISLRNNVIYDSHQSWGGVLPRHMRFADNYWDDDKLVFYGSTRNLKISNNTLLEGRSPGRACERIARCASILDGAGLEPSWRARLGLQASS